MIATTSLPALNKAWVRVLLALPSPYWAKEGLGESLIGLTPVFIELNKAWVRALLALPSPY